MTFFLNCNSIYEACLDMHVNIFFYVMFNYPVDIQAVYTKIDSHCVVGVVVLLVGVMTDIIDFGYIVTFNIL